MKRIGFLAALLLLCLVCTMLARERLIWIELGEERLHPLLEQRLCVVAELESHALVVADEKHMDGIERFAYRILDGAPFEGEYYVVIPLDPDIPLEHSGEVLAREGPQYLMRLEEGMIESLIKEKVMVARLSLKPLVIRYAPSPLVFRSNPVIQSIVDDVDPDSVLGFVQRLQDFVSRYSTHDSCFAAAAFIADRFGDYGCDSVFYQYFQGGHAPNVIGVKRGLLHPDSIYTVICGHFDATSEQAPQIAPGADDNASGTVAALEAARVLNGHDFQYSIRYIAFAGEEFGLYGSDYYATGARTDGDSILGAINGDMIGYVDAMPESLEVIARTSSPPCGWLADLFIAAADTYTTLLTDKHMTSSYVPSDNQSFWNNGYPALCNIEDYMPVNPHYHLTSDTIGAGYNSNQFATEVIKAEIAAIATIARPLMQSYLMPLSNWIDDPAPGGNGNGYWEGGEEVDLVVSIINAGTNTALNAQAALTTTDPYVTVITGNLNLGDIASNDTVDAPFHLLADGGTPPGYQADFDLHLSCSSGDWYYDLTIAINPLPLLTYQQHRIVGGNGDGILDPGETADLVVTIMNEGARDADNVTSTLSSLSPHLTVNDPYGAFGAIAVGDTANNTADPYTLSADSLAPHGTIAPVRVIVTSSVHSDTLVFDIVIGKKHYYLWNPDPTPAPGTACHTLLTSLGYSGDYGTTLAADLSQYCAVLVCVGIYNDNYVIADNSPEAAALANFVTGGGRMYLEGGDVWYWDPLYGGYDFGPLFGIDAIDDGNDDLSIIGGQYGTFTEGMSFSYSGENNYIDRIDPEGSGFLIFSNSSPVYNCGVANDAGSYRTVGTSFELGLLDDASPPSTRAALLDSVMRFFGIPKPGIAEIPPSPRFPAVSRLEAPHPAPFSRRLVIGYQIGREVKKGDEVRLSIFDVTGRMVREFAAPPREPYNHIVWDGKGSNGRAVAAGVYFIHLRAGSSMFTSKAILVR